MSRFSRITGGLMLALMVPAMLPQISYAQETITSACLTETYERMAHEERMFRTVVFGQKKSADLPTGSVRFDTEYDTWLKTGGNQWKSLNEGNTGTTWSDRLMDEQSDIKDRRGLLEMRKTPTSDIIPPLLQSMRALQCRLRAVCLAVSQSSGAKEGEKIKVQPIGCQEFELPVFAGCKAASVVETVPVNCNESVDAIIRRESQLLQLVVAYDAAYRTLMQFSGIFEDFLKDFRFPLLEPLWQTVRTLGQFDNLSCFAGQCDE
jgi:hypothetical protein